MSSPMLTVSGLAVEVVASDGSVALIVSIALKRRSGRRGVGVAGAGPEGGTHAAAAGAGPGPPLATDAGNRRGRLHV